MKTAFLGLGVMGGAMAANLAKARFEVFGWNRTPGSPGVAVASSSGVKVRPTIREAVRDADVVFTCVSDVEDVNSVMLGEAGVRACIKPGAVVVDTSTIGPTAAREIGMQLKASEIVFVDAPVTGGDEGARNGTLTFMVGGDEEAISTIRPLLDAMGKMVFHCGPVGSGQSVKLCNQILCGVHMIALCEALAAAKSEGIDPKLVIQVCSTGAGGSWALERLGPRILSGDLASGFAVQHMLKDLRLVLENVGQLPGVELARALFAESVNKWRDSAQRPGTQAMVLAYENSAKPLSSDPAF